MSDFGNLVIDASSKITRAWINEEGTNVTVANENDSRDIVMHTDPALIAKIARDSGGRLQRFPGTGDPVMCVNPACIKLAFLAVDGSCTVTITDDEEEIDLRVSVPKKGHVALLKSISDHGETPPTKKRKRATTSDDEDDVRVKKPKK